MKKLGKITPLICLLMFASCSMEDTMDLTPYDVVWQDFHRAYTLVNEYRVEEGQERLIYSSVLQEYCKVRVEQLIILGGLNHQGFYDLNLADNLGVQFASEVIASGHSTSETVVEAWKNSEPHNRVLIGNYDHVGVYESEGFWAMIFVKQ